MEERDLSRRQERHINKKTSSGETPKQPAFLTLQYNFFRKQIGEPNHLNTNYDTVIKYIAFLDILKSTVTVKIGKRQIVTSCFNFWCIECTIFQTH
jgi:hypothetical protein